MFIFKIKIPWGIPIFSFDTSVLIEVSWLKDFFWTFAGECCTGIMDFLFVCNRGDVSPLLEWASTEEDFFNDFFWLWVGDCTSGLMIGVLSTKSGVLGSLWPPVIVIKHPQIIISSPISTKFLSRKIPGKIIQKIRGWNFGKRVSQIFLKCIPSLISSVNWMLF